MIHLLLLLDRNKSIGLPLFDNKKINIRADLLIGLVQAMMLLGEEMGEAKGPLREAELGEYQISILSEDHLAYCVVQDTWDSEPFTHKILNKIIEKHHQHLVMQNFNLKIEREKELKEDIVKLLHTMKFPKGKLPTLKDSVDRFLLKNKNQCDTFFLADLDDGIIHIWEKPENEGIVKILMEILSEIPFERQWVGESKLVDPIRIDGEFLTHEAWFIYRIGLTDYCILGRAFYHPAKHRKQFINTMQELTSTILSSID